MVVEPGPQPGALAGIAPLHAKDTTLQFQDGDRREKEGCRIFPPDPGDDIGIGLAVANLPQFGDNVGVEQIGQDRSTARETISIRSGEKSISESPGIDRASMRLRRFPERRLKSS